jgi:hypothetical protein
MKVALLIAKRLADLGVERPAPALVEILEKEVSPKIEALVASTLSVRLVARAFAATLSGSAAEKGSEGKATASPHQQQTGPFA